MGCSSEIKSAQCRGIQSNYRLVILSLGTFCLHGMCMAEDDPAKAYDQTLNQNRAAAEQRSTNTSTMTPQQLKAYTQAQTAARAKEDQKKNLANYKEKTMLNLASIKELFAKGEDAWKNKKFRDATTFYSSVALADVPGSEEMSQTSRGRLVEMEELGNGHLKSADDADLQREYVKEVDELSTTIHEFPQTKAHDVAMRRMINLKSRPDVAGHVELAQAAALESDGKLTEAVKMYDEIANSPRYEHTLPALKARRKLDDLNNNEGTKTKIKAAMDAKADKEAPLLLASAKNFISNNLPKQAIEKLQQVLEKFPDTKYAETARQQLGGLK